MTFVYGGLIPPDSADLTVCVSLIYTIAKRAEFDWAAFCKLMKDIYLGLNSCNGKDLEELHPLLIKNDFILF